MEAVWTFLLATVVLQTATTETQAGNSFFGLSIGMTVVAGAITAGRTSRPATAFQCIFSHILHSSHFRWCVQSGRGHGHPHGTIYNYFDLLLLFFHVYLF
jgi:glycerol uptake facilitator-like aquaporin